MIKTTLTKKWNAVLIAYSTCVTIYVFWIVVLGSFRNQVIPHLVDCKTDLSANITDISPCDLTNIGSSSIEVLVGIFIAILFFKLQKDHAEKLLKVERSVTKKIYAREIQFYTCDFAFDLQEGSEPKISEQQILNEAQKFLSKIESNASKISDTFIDGRGDAHELEFPEGKAVITLAKQVQNSCFNVGMHKTINLHLKCENFTLFDKIIQIGERPYWDLQWHVLEKYDVINLMQKIAESQGKQPFSSGTMNLQDGTRAGSASYSLPSVNNVKISAELFPDFIGLTCVGRIPNGGFFKAHKKFKPEDLLSILLGEVTYVEVHELLKRSLEK